MSNTQVEAQPSRALAIASRFISGGTFRLSAPAVTEHYVYGSDGRILFMAPNDCAPKRWDAAFPLSDVEAHRDRTFRAPTLVTVEIADLIGQLDLIAPVHDACEDCGAAPGECEEDAWCHGGTEETRGRAHSLPVFLEPPTVRIGGGGGVWLHLAAHYLGAGLEALRDLGATQVDVKGVMVPPRGGIDARDSAVKAAAFLAVGRGAFLLMPIAHRAEACHGR